LLVRLLVWLALLGVGACLGAAPTPVLAQGAPATAPQAPVQTGPITGTVDQIRIEGTQRVEPETVRSYLAIKPGDSFNADQVDRSLKNLYATGLFSDVSMRREGSTLVVVVTENPIINRLAFEGNSKLSNEDLTNEVQLRPRVVYTRTKVQSDVQRILDVYRRNGRFAATVDPKIIELPQNRVDLVFEINEGPSTGISRIAFVGNHRFSDSALKGTLQTKETRWYRFLSSDDTYDPDRVTLDRDLLRRFYLKNGYADFRVLSAVAELAPDGDSFYLTFTIDEGERYKFGKIDVTTTLPNLDVEQLKSLVTVDEGDWYNAEAVDSTVKALTDAVGTRGYAFAQIEPVVNRDRDKRILGINFQVQEGPRVYVERIDIEGNVRTLDSVIRREFQLVEGDAFNTSKLQRTEKRLKDLAYFKKVEVKPVPGSAPDRTVLQTTVEEQSTGDFTIGAGYSTTDGPLAQFSIRERNLLGRGQTVQANALIAAKRSEYDVGFTEPYFLNRELAATVDVFHTTQQAAQNLVFDSQSTGGYVGLGYHLTDNLTHGVRYTLRRDTISNVQPGASRFILEQVGSRLASIVTNQLDYDRLDSRIDPTDGYYLRGAVDLAGAGGDVHFARVTGSARKYFPIAPEYVLLTRIDGGYIKGLGEGVRIEDRFFLGGDNFRGFRIGAVGPHDVVTLDDLGANTYYVGTVEMSFPVGLPKELGVSGRVFTDFGSSFGVDEPSAAGQITDSGSLRISTGVGFSWHSPFGPIRLDLGYPVVKEKLDRTEIIRVSFGTNF
jgi:outer membrane protein insertion porin family